MPLLDFLFIWYMEVTPQKVIEENSKCFPFGVEAVKKERVNVFGKSTTLNAIASFIAMILVCRKQQNIIPLQEHQLLHWIYSIKEWLIHQVAEVRRLDLS